MAASVLICAAIGALIAMFIGWLMLPSAPKQQLRMRVAVSNDVVIIGVKVGDEVQFIQFNR